MLVAAFFLLLAYACVRGLTRDAGVIVFVLAIGFLQDPIRKIITGEPVVMTIMTGLVVASMALRQLSVNPQAAFDPFVKWTDSIAPSVKLLLFIILLQAIHSLARYGSPVLTGLGAIFYVAPLVAIIVGYAHFHRFESVREFIFAFTVFALIVALSVIYSYLGGESDLLGEVGAGLIIYDQGTILKAYSGLMRSSEISSWHMGVCVCFLVILVVDRGSMPIFLGTALSIAILIGAIILTGRRKMILQIVIFSCIYFPLLRYYQQRLSNRFLMLLFISVSVFSVLYVLILPTFQGTSYDLYLARSVSVFSDAGERFSQLGLGSVSWAIRDHGFWGSGLGVTSQGAQHFVSGELSGSGEGGIGKLVSELGVISLFVVPWVGWVFAKHLHRCVKLVASAVPDKLPFVVGVLVFLLANIPTFAVASQVYGDVFVLVILGLLAGALFALPKQVVSRIELTNTRNAS